MVFANIKTFFKSVVFTKAEDRISLLPDCLLLDIISRLDLSTKEVIKTTSVISKRWQHLWTQLPTLVFIYRDDIPKDLYLDFYTSRAHYFSFIDKTLSQCPTDMNLNKFQLRITYDSQFKSQIFSWIRHAITHNVQEVNLKIWDNSEAGEFSYDDEFFFNNSCVTSMSFSSRHALTSYVLFNPPNVTIRWDKLKCLCIKRGRLDEDIMGKILSGSPCLETMEFKSCCFVGCFTNSLFANFGVERLSCSRKAYELLTNGDERFWNRSEFTSMKLSRCLSRNGNAWVNLNFLCIYETNMDEDSMGKVLSGSPCLETLELKGWYGVRRINVASTSVKNLVVSGYGRLWARLYIDTLEIDAPNILSLTIKGKMNLEKILLLNVSSLVEADFDYASCDDFAKDLGREKEDIEDELLKGLLTSLGHVNEITLKDNCLEAFSRLKKRGFPEVHSTSCKENILNCSYRFYLLIIILLFSFWVANRMAN